MAIKKKALSALVLGSLCAQASNLLQEPAEHYEKLGSQYRFGETIDPDRVINPRNHPSATTPEITRQTTEENRSTPAEITALEEPKSPAAKDPEAIHDPFGGRAILLTCGARCGIPLSDYSTSSEE